MMKRAMLGDSMYDFLNRIDLDDQITQSFKWSEALLLRAFNFYAYPTKPQRINIFNLAMKLEEIKQVFYNEKITITSWFRPTFYNSFVQGSKNSLHIEGKAVDFNVFGVEPARVQQTLFPLVDKLKIRLEIGTPTWTHVDLGYVERSPNNIIKLTAPK